MTKHIDDWFNLEGGYCPAKVAEKIIKDIVKFGRAMADFENNKIGITDLSKIGARINRNLNKLGHGKANVMTEYLKYRGWEDE